MGDNKSLGIGIGFLSDFLNQTGIIKSKIPIWVATAAIPVKLIIKTIFEQSELLNINNTGVPTTKSSTHSRQMALAKKMKLENIFTPTA
ncbi:hypothetical protein ACJX0J_032197, partial [Zea mays]